MSARKGSIRDNGPRWVLSERWGLDTDKYQWILCRKVQSKKGKPTRWEEDKFFPRAHQVLEHILHQETRDAFDGNVQMALESGYERASEIVRQFSSLLAERGMSDMKPFHAPVGGVEELP